MIITNSEILEIPKNIVKFGNWQFKFQILDVLKETNYLGKQINYFTAIAIKNKIKTTRYYGGQKYIINNTEHSVTSVPGANGIQIKHLQAGLEITYVVTCDAHAFYM